MSVIIDEGIGLAKPDFFTSVQVVAVLSMGYCDNDYTINGILNYLLNSEDFSSWNALAGTIITANAATAPDGTLTADKIEDADAASIKGVFQSSGLVAANATATYSFWLKADVPHFCECSMNDSTDTEGTTVKLYVDKQWRRFKITRTFTAGATGNVKCYIRPTQLVNAEVGYVYAWGAQLVPGSFPLRYQKTTAAYLETSKCHAVDLGDGLRCFKTFPTCQDLDNYLAVTRKWAFCMRGGYLIQPSQMPGDISMVRPYISRMGYLSQRIDPSRSITESSRITLTMSDDKNPGAFDGSQQFFNTNPNGSFWRLWLERYRNFPYRLAEIWFVPYPDGVIGDSVNSPARRKFKGIIEDMVFNSNGTIDIILKDLLKKTHTKTPAQISADNVLLTDLTASVWTNKVIRVSRASEFTDPASIPTIGGVQKSKPALRIGGDAPEKTEIFVIKSVDLVNNTLTVDGSQFGSTAQAHPINSKLREIIVYRDTVAPYVGFNPLDIELDLLLRSGISDTDLNVASFTGDRDTWLTGKTMSRIIEGPEDIEDMLREIRQLIFSSIWVDEDQLIRQRLLPPSNPATANLQTFTDAANIVALSLGVQVRDVDRINRVLLFYDPVDYESGSKDIASFRKAIFAEDLDATDTRNYGKTAPPLVIYSKWFNQDDQESAFFFAKKILALNKNGMRRLTWDIHLKDSNVQVGGSLKISSRDMIDAFGNKTETELFVVEKRVITKTRFQLVALSLRDKSKYGVVAPNGTPNFNNAASTAEQRAKYVYIGNKFNKVGNGTIEGYKSW